MIAPVGGFVRFTLPVEFKECRSLSQNKRGKHTVVPTDRLAGALEGKVRAVHFATVPAE